MAIQITIIKSLSLTSSGSCEFTLIDSLPTSSVGGVGFCVSCTNIHILDDILMWYVGTRVSQGSTCVFESQLWSGTDRTVERKRKPSEM